MFDLYRDLGPQKPHLGVRNLVFLEKSNLIRENRRYLFLLRRTITEKACRVWAKDVKFGREKGSVYMLLPLLLYITLHAKSWVTCAKTLRLKNPTLELEIQYLECFES